MWEHKWWGEAGGEREAGFPLSREPDVGLDPRTLRSRPELEADASLTKTPRHPIMLLIIVALF